MLNTNAFRGSIIVSSQRTMTSFANKMRVIFRWRLDCIIPMDEEKLIEAIRCYLCLWQVSSKSYRDLIVKENARKEVALQVRL